MGYRSEVSYIVRFKDSEDREAYINMLIVAKNEHTTQALKELSKLENDKLFFHAEDVKWYDSYPDVVAHTQIYLQAVELFEGAGYRYVRIGEEVEDIEIEEDGEYDDLWDYTSINRSIDVCVDADKLKPILTTEGELV
jgi:hypothetical protein